MDTKNVSSNSLSNSGTYMDWDADDIFNGDESTVEKSEATTDTPPPTPPVAAQSRHSHKMPNDAVRLSDRKAENLPLDALGISSGDLKKSKASRIAGAVKSAPGRAFHGARDAANRSANFIGNGVSNAWQRLRPGSAASATPDPVAAKAKEATAAAFAEKFFAEDTSVLSRTELGTIEYQVTAAIRNAGIDSKAVAKADVSDIASATLEAFYDSKNELKNFRFLAGEIPEGAVSTFSNLAKLAPDVTPEHSLIRTTLNALDIFSENDATDPATVLKDGAAMFALLGEVDSTIFDAENYQVIDLVVALQNELETIRDNAIQQSGLPKAEAETLFQLFNDGNAIAEEINNPTQFGEKIHADADAVRNNIESSVGAMRTLATSYPGAKPFLDAAIASGEAHLKSLENLESYGEQFDDIAAIDILRKQDTPLTADQRQEAGGLIRKLNSFISKDIGSSDGLNLEETLERDLLVAMQAKANHSVMGMESALSPVTRSAKVESIRKVNRFELDPATLQKFEALADASQAKILGNGMSEIFHRDLTGGLTFTFGEKSVIGIPKNDEAAAVAEFAKILEFTGGNRQDATMLTALVNQELGTTASIGIMEGLQIVIGGDGDGTHTFDIQKEGANYIVQFSKSERINGVMDAATGQNSDCSQAPLFGSTSLTLTVAPDYSITPSPLVFTVSEAPVAAVKLQGVPPKPNPKTVAEPEPESSVAPASTPTPVEEGSSTPSRPAHETKLLAALGIAPDAELFTTAQKAGLLTPAKVKEILADKNPLTAFAILATGANDAAGNADRASFNKRVNLAIIDLTLPAFHLERKKVRGDGDCFYDAVARQFPATEGKTAKNALDVRAEMHNHLANLLQEHPEAGDNVWSKFLKVGTRDDIKRWVDSGEIRDTASFSKAEAQGKTRPNGAWATAEYASLAAILYDRPVVLFNGTLAQIFGEGNLFEVHLPSGPAFDADYSESDLNRMLADGKNAPVILTYDGVNHFDLAEAIKPTESD